jgi:hypothetical protein
MVNKVEQLTRRLPGDYVLTRTNGPAERGVGRPRSHSITHTKSGPVKSEKYMGCFDLLRTRSIVAGSRGDPSSKTSPL